MRRLTFLLILILLPSLALACIWDYDTLKQERSRFPSALELITGKFLRHSPEFYEWRIRDRTERLKYDPDNASLYDDLAVAYSKVGKFDRAIETMEALEKKQPGRYETNSNLGTFYFLSGQVEKGLPFIDKALAINPDAHFGREKYQRWLGEMLLQHPSETNFATFLDEKFQNSFSSKKKEEAVIAILGMMRFANHDNPILLQALADLLLYPRNHQESYHRLATRAILRKGYNARDKTFSEPSLEQADNALQSQTQSGINGNQLPLKELSARFLKELDDAEKWYDALRAKEIDWIASGQNPEIEFDKLYTNEPAIEDEPSDQFPRPWTHRHSYAISAGLASLFLLATQTAFFFIFRLFSRNRTTALRHKLRLWIFGLLFVLNLLFLIPMGCLFLTIVYWEFF